MNAAPTPTDDDAFEAMRALEIEWLTATLSHSIANLGYPVGCGIAPNPEQMAGAAAKLFDRYLKMFRHVRETALAAGDTK